MKYQNSFFGGKTEFADFIKQTIPDLFGGRLDVEGQKVTLPADKDLAYKVKFDEDESGGSVTIKVAWKNAAQEVQLVEEDEFNFKFK